MAKILTGVQSTGTPHLGNLLGAIIPSIKMANKSNEESYFFIANLHSLTQIKDPCGLIIILSLLYNPSCLILNNSFLS